MKNIKLKNYGACMFLLYLPALLFFAAGIGSMFLADKYGDWLGFLGVGFLVAACIVVLVGYITLLYVECALTAVKNRLNAPVRYDYTGNGTTAQEIEQAIVSRCRKKLKRETKCASTKHMPVCARGQHSYSISDFYLSTERGAIVFRAPHLTAELYHNIMSDAMAQHRAIHSQRWDKIKNKKTPQFATAVIIIADSTDNEAAEIVLKKIKAEKGYVLPCVIDASTQGYCFDGEKEIAVTNGIIFEKNLCISLLKKLIFGGKAPKPDKKYIKSFDDMDYNPETPFLELLSNTLKNMKETKKGAKKELAEMAEKLGDGQTEILEEVCYCKIGDNIGVSLMFAEDEDEPKKVDVLILEEWQYPKSKKLTKDELSTLRRLTESALKKEGYEYTFAEDEFK